MDNQKCDIKERLNTCFVTLWVLALKNTAVLYPAYVALEFALRFFEAYGNWSFINIRYIYIYI